MATTSNEHFLKRNRNLRNELLKQTDYFMLPDVYEILTTEQKEEIKNYRQSLRNIFNENQNKYLQEGIAFVEFPNPPEWTKIKNVKY